MEASIKQAVRKVLIYPLDKLQHLSFYRRLAGLLKRGITIKEANEEGMRSFYRWVNPKKPIAIRRNPNVTNFVAKKAHKVIDFVQLVTHPNNNLYSGWWLSSLSIKPIYRGMGIGEELTKAVIEKAKTHGAKELSLVVREDNKNAIGLYKKIGFKRKIKPGLEENLEKEAIKTGHRRILMSVNLRTEGVTMPNDEI